MYSLLIPQYASRVKVNFTTDRNPPIGTGFNSRAYVTESLSPNGEADYIGKLDASLRCRNKGLSAYPVISIGKVRD